jgi:hypothetical protein
VQHTVTLTCHPASPTTAVQAIRARIGRAAAGVSVSYELQGDLSRISVPDIAAQGFADELWQHTCFEMFVRRGDGPAYHELNFSPSGEWALYAFERYREGHALRGFELEPRIAIRRGAHTLELDAAVKLDRLLPRTSGPLFVGLSAVVEENDGTLSYWALRHGPGKPDFHHRDAFELKLS